MDNKTSHSSHFMYVTKTCPGTTFFLLPTFHLPTIPSSPPYLLLHIPTYSLPHPIPPTTTTCPTCPLLPALQAMQESCSPVAFFAHYHLPHTPRLFLPALLTTITPPPHRLPAACVHTYFSLTLLLMPPTFAFYAPIATPLTFSLSHLFYTCSPIPSHAILSSPLTFISLVSHISLPSLTCFERKEERKEGGGGGGLGGDMEGRGWRR